jgi:hypothetical protein
VPIASSAMKDASQRQSFDDGRRDRVAPPASLRFVAATQHRPIEDPDSDSAWHLPVDGIDMRLAFVLRLGNQTRPAAGFFEGSVEEVDSCTEVRFRSTEELLKFLGQRFDLTMGKNRSSQGDAACTGSKARGTKRTPTSLKDGKAT